MWRKMHLVPRRVPRTFQPSPKNGEVSRNPWSSEMCVYDLSIPSIRGMVTFITGSRIITATTVVASLSNASSNIASLMAKRTPIERLLVERISLRGICRAVGVELTWLLSFLIQCVDALPDHLHVQPITSTTTTSRFDALRRKQTRSPASSRRKPTSSGSGSRWMPRRVRSLPFTWVIRSRKSAKRLLAKIS